MKVWAFFLLVVIKFTTLKAQEATVAAGGDAAASSSGKVSYTIGQVAYSGLSNSTGELNEGVQQPYEFLLVGLYDTKDIKLELLVYPNPTLASIHLKIESQDLKNLSACLYDMSGKLLLREKIEKSETPIPLETFMSANYFLKVFKNNIEIETFKIIKNK